MEERTFASEVSHDPGDPFLTGALTRLDRQPSILDPGSSNLHLLTSKRADWRNIFVLLLLTAAIHGWLIRHTEVPARDAVGFIRYAWRLQHEPWGEVMRTSHQHPGYPWAITIVSKPLSWMSYASSCDLMTLSAQGVNLMAGCLLALVMYLLGRKLFNRRIGFWTAALFQCLPVVARVTSDALSETTFLLTATLTLLLAVRSLKDYTVGRLALCGACGGCCYLIRPEGALTVVAVASVLVGLQVSVRWRRPWKMVFTATGSLAAAALLVAAPYIAVIGHFTNKPTGQAVMEVASQFNSKPMGIERDGETRRQGDRENTGQADDETLFQSDVRNKLSPCLPFSLSPCLFATWWHSGGQDNWFARLTWGPWAVVKEVVRGFGYFIWLPALLGLRWFHRYWRNNPATWILGILCLLQAILLCRVGLVVGYVSERHVLIIVLCGLYGAVWAILQMPERWGRRRKRIEGRASKIEDGGEEKSKLARSSVLSGAIMVTLIFAFLPMTLQPLHANQVGHREAGLWLALHSHPEDTIVDPFNWAYFYAGRVFEEGSSSPALPDHPTTRYVVLELSRKPHAGLTWLPLAKQLAEGGQVVYDWRPDKHQLKHKAQEVQIFAVPVSSQ